MIQNEKEKGITQKWLSLFKQALEDIERNKVFRAPIVYRAMRSLLEEQIKELQEELDTYNKVN